MESDLRQCNNKRCPRFHVLVVNAKHCTSCGRKMGPGFSNGHAPGTFDTPPLIESGYEGYYRGGNNERFLEWREQARQRSAVTQLTLPTNLAPMTAKTDDIFTCDGDPDHALVKGCPITPSAPKVNIPILMFRQWVFLAEQFDTEWIAYLKGRLLEDGNYSITAFYFPKQIANGAHVDVAEDAVIEEGTIGSVHSHVGMSAFFSGEDEKHFNHDVELVVNRDGNICANVRIKLQCGRDARKDTTVMLTGCDQELGLVDALKGKLTEEQHHHSTTWQDAEGSSSYYDKSV